MHHGIMAGCLCSKHRFNLQRSSNTADSTSLTHCQHHGSLSYTAFPTMSDSGGFNPFDDGEAVPEPTSPPHSSSPVAHSSSTPSSASDSSPLTTSSGSQTGSTTPYKPPADADADADADTKPNGFHPQQHEKTETLYDHLARTDPPTSHSDTTTDAPASTRTDSEDQAERETEGDDEAEEEPAETSDEYADLVSSEPSLFLNFQLAALPDSFVDTLNSLFSLTTSLSALQAHYTTQHAATLAASLASQHRYQQQQATIRHDITSLQTQLATLDHTKQSHHSTLSTLTQTVTHKTEHHTTLTTQLATLTQQHSHLATKLARRSRPQQQQQQRHGRLRLFTLRPPVGEQRRLAVPGEAVDGIFGFLTVREVESAVRTCKRWQWVVGRNGVWNNALKRIAGNKKKKEREREETGEQVTHDEFDHWTDTNQSDHDSADLQDSGGSEVDGSHPPASPSNKRKVKDDAAFHLTPAAAAALNLPPVDSPVPDHLHYALTVDLTRDLYSIHITSRHINTLYQCAACMDSLTPGQPAPSPLPKTSSLVICCTLVPKAASVTELHFCEQMMAMQEQSTVAKQDVTRLQRQLTEDRDVKRRLQTELATREHQLRTTQHELDTALQQQMSDEMTRQFLDDSLQTVTEQLGEERAQTVGLRGMLREAYERREVEVGGMEREVEGMVVVVEGLKEEKGKLAREVKRLQVELDGVTGERERAKREYERLMALIEQLREL